MYIVLAKISQHQPAHEEQDLNLFRRHGAEQHYHYDTGWHKGQGANREVACAKPRTNLSTIYRSV
jgi:hypothetical protein